MLYPDKSIFKHSYTDVYTSKGLGNVNFGEEYQHLDETSEHVETYFKLQRKAQRVASVACDAHLPVKPRKPGCIALLC